MKTILALILLAFSSTIFAQTDLLVKDVSSLPNKQIIVPIEVGSTLDPVGSMTLHLEYDPAVLDFNNEYQNSISTVNFSVSNRDGIITIGWFDSNPVTITDKIVDLIFEYKSGNTSISFTGVNEITDDFANPYQLNLVNGTITEVLPDPVEVNLSNVVATAGEQISVSLNGKDFDEVGSFTFKFTYDTNVLTYIDFENMIGGTANINAQDNFITIGYFNGGGVTLEGGVLLKFNFNYVGGNTDLVFDAAISEVTNLKGDVIPFTTVDGIVEENNPPVIVVPSDTTINQEEELQFSVSATDPDDDEVVISADELPDGAEFELDVFTWTPTTDQSGEFLAVFTAVDPLGAFDTDTVKITVLEINQAPYFTQELGDSLWEISSWPATLEFQFEAEDPNGDDLIYTLVSGPDKASINEDGLFTYTPDPDKDSADYMVNYTVAVSDGEFTVESSGKITRQVIVNVNSQNGIPNEYKVFQNYPNPFNPSSTIKFALPVQSSVKIAVYNSLGQYIETLLDSDLAAGYHTVKFNAVDLSSGIYFYKISASAIDGSKEISKMMKMMLLK